MNKWRKHLWFILLYLIVLFWYFSTNTTLTYAALTSNNDLQTLSKAPEGISLPKFLTQTNPDNSKLFNTNSAQLVDQFGNNSASANTIVLASGPNSYGAMWSKDRSFDINKPHTISAWLYFGRNDTDDGDPASEGIAFVLQNDADNTSALGANLQSMGVYGYDASFPGIIPNDNAAPQDIQKTAVKNSVALEFDTMLNNIYSENAEPLKNPNENVYSMNGYDTQAGTISDLHNSWSQPSIGAGDRFGHIALTYPGLIDSYYPIELSTIQVPNKFSAWHTVYSLIHDTPTKAALNTGSDQDGTPRYWHHLTLNWTPPKPGSHFATLSYHYHDKNQDSSTNTAPSYKFSTPLSKNMSVDTSKLNSTDGLVRWGFTAANNSEADVQSKFVVLDEIPELLAAKATSNLVDTTLNSKNITDASTDVTVGAGDLLKFNYDLNYLNGNTDWQNIMAKVKIPENLNLYPDADGNIGTITYDNNVVKKIPATQLIDHTLQDIPINTLGTTANATGKHALVSINVQAFNNTKKEISVSKAIARFDSPSALTSTSTPVFKISAGKDYSLNLKSLSKSNDINLIYKQNNATLNLPTALNYSDNHTFSGNSIIYQINVNNTQNYTLAVNATGTDFPQTIDLKKVINSDATFWNLFAPDTTKQITVKAIDTANGLTSKPITYNVKTIQNKSLSLNVSKNLQFRDINYLSTTKYLPRKTSFVLKVTSMMEPWQLRVSTKGLFLAGKTFNDKMSMVYKKNETSPYLALNSTPTLVEEDPTPHTESTLTDIAKKWKANTGILLKQYGISTSGSYSGNLTWTVSNSVNNT